MFLGSIPAAMRSITAEHVAHWGDDVPVGVACSGNFTIERLLAKRWPGREIHGCDVSLYIPPEAAQVIRRAVDRMVGRDEAASAWQAIEFMAASYLAGD